MEESRDETTEQLIARCIAPVNNDFLRPPPVRNDDVSIPNDNKPPSLLIAKDKKSKRQLKRERKQDQNSTKNLCPEVSKSGDVNSCRYKDKCRFSHDIQAFKAQKLDDLEGECPFKSQGCCPYGLSCRFSSTHEEGMPVSSSNGLKERSEVNGFSKDVQKLLWKSNMSYPKADSQLRSLGLTIKARKNDIERLTQKDGDKCVKSNDNGFCVEKSEVKSEAEVKFEVKSDVKFEVKSEVKSELENQDDGDQGHQFYDDDSCGVTADSGPKLECSAEVIKADGIKRELESDIPCPQKRIKTEENCGGEETENEGVNVNDQNVDGSCIKSEPKAETEDITPETDLSLKSHRREKKLIDFREKLYLAPLTTVGNLPFRRVCKVLGADVTCGEMAMCTNLLQGQASEWALLRRHSSEDLFGIQICGAYPDTVARTVELIEKECTIDFIDINMGCPIDIVVNKGAGSALLTKPMRMKSVVEVASGTVDIPITMKVRTAYFEGKNRIDSLIADFSSWGASAVTIHGRSRQQRYSKLADWDYVYQCTKKAPKYLQVVGNGDVFSFVDWNNHKTECPELSTCMIARGALIKPWIFTEIKEQRHWDISSGERLNIFKDFVHFGLQHWGSDTKGVETTRRFLLEWLSYTCRYIPVGLLDVVPQRLNWRPPSYYGRDELETLMASDSAADWVRLSEMLLGKVPDGYTFAPKHKSNAYDRAENG